MKWKRTEVRLWRLVRPAKPFFKKHYDGEVTIHYFGTLAVSFEHWYEVAEQSVQADSYTGSANCDCDRFVWSGVHEATCATRRR